jgi:hypothetical protein
MSLKSDLLTLNRMHSGEPQQQLPYTLDDVRHILITTVKFNKTHTFKGTLPPDTINKLRSEGLDVSLDENNYTVVSWKLR